MLEYAIALKALVAVVPWLSLLLATVAVTAVVGLWRFHRSEGNLYDLWDLLMEHGKADLSKHLVLAFAILSIWVIVRLTIDGKPVETLLLGCLGIFVVGRVVNGVTNTIKGVPPDPPMQDVPKEPERMLPPGGK